MYTDTALDGRIVMDQAAFARFSETASIAQCGTRVRSTWPGQLSVDADGAKIMLEAREQKMGTNPGLLQDLHKAAQAGRVDGAFISARMEGPLILEVVVFNNSETWAGWGDCHNKPIDIGPAATHRTRGGGQVVHFRKADGAVTKHRVRRHTPLQQRCCGGTDSSGDGICRHDEEPIPHDDGPVIDIATFWPPRATGQLEQALAGAALIANTGARWELGRIAWNATGPDQRNMFRGWLEALDEATGDRHVVWVPDLFDDDGLVPSDGIAAKLNYRPVCADTGGTLRGLCPAFLTCDPGRPGAIRVLAHVGNPDLVNAAKLAAGGAVPAEAVAIIAAITHPDRT